MNQVEDFITNLDHPLEQEIRILREIILESNSSLKEHIKWNAPSFYIDNEDYISLKLYPLLSVQVIFHRGAHVKEVPQQKLIESKSKLINWVTNDRGFVKFKNLKDIDAQKTEFKELVNLWVNSGS